jgi:aryl sulfotransferase
MAVSLYRQGENIDRAKARQLLGRPEPAEPEPARRPLRDWLLDWMDNDADPRERLNSLLGVIWHMSDAWAIRGEPNIMLIHHDDLACDLNGQIRQIADRLGITIPEPTWPGLVEAATFLSMKASADQLLGTRGILTRSAALFPRGKSGGARDPRRAGDAHYHRRVAQMAPSDMLTWLHSPGRRYLTV